MLPGSTRGNLLEPQSPHTSFGTPLLPTSWASPSCLWKFSSVPLGRAVPRPTLTAPPGSYCGEACLSSLNHAKAEAAPRPPASGVAATDSLSSLNFLSCKMGLFTPPFLQEASPRSGSQVAPLWCHAGHSSTVVIPPHFKINLFLFLNRELPQVKNCILFIFIFPNLVPVTRQILQICLLNE